MDNNSMLDFRSNVVGSPNVVCECGSKLFTQQYVLKNLSAIVSPTGAPQVVEIPVFVCAKCGEIPSEFKQNANYKYISGEEVKQVSSIIQ
jgi:hypothetical protein